MRNGTEDRDLARSPTAIRFDPVGQDAAHGVSGQGQSDTIWGDMHMRPRAQLAYGLWLRAIAFFVAWLLVYVLSLLPLIGALETGMDEKVGQVIAEVLAVSTALATGWVYSRSVDGNRRFWTVTRPRFALEQLLAGLFLGASMLTAMLLVMGFSGRLGLNPDASLSLRPLSLAVAAVSLNAAAQEIVFRGHIQRILAQAGQQSRALIVSASLFTLAHLGQFGGSWTGAANLFLAGILLGYAYQLTGSVWLPIGIHVAWNVGLGPLAGLTVSGRQMDGGFFPFRVLGDDILTGGEFGMEASPIASAVTLLCAAVLWLAIGRSPRRTDARQFRQTGSQVSITARWSPRRTSQRTRQGD